MTDTGQQIPWRFFIPNQGTIRNLVNRCRLAVPCRMLSQSADQAETSLTDEEFAAGAGRFMESSQRMENDVAVPEVIASQVDVVFPAQGRQILQQCLIDGMAVARLQTQSWY